MIKLFLFLAILLSLFSCLKEVQIVYPEQDSRIVINSFLESGNNISVMINESSGISHEIPIDSKNIIAVVSNNEITDTLKYVEDGWYNSKIIVEEGGNYLIQVDNQIQEINSETNIPYSVPFEVSNFISNAGSTEDGYFYSSIKISFIDPKSIENHYQIFIPIQDLYNDNFYAPKVFGHPWSDHISVRNEWETAYKRRLLFSDDLFDGDSVSLKVFFHRNRINGKVVFHLRSLSNDLFNYMKSLDLHLVNSDPYFLDYIGEPSALYSNILNGYGIFAGYSFTSDTIQTTINN